MKVSIITVVFNGVETIEQTIKSVINQSYKNIEYIIIDGGSTDGTLDIIRKYENYLSYVISEPDNGIYDAMNKGIQKTTGDIIGIINSDDWYERNTVSQVVERFISFDVDLVYGDINFVERDGRIIRSEKCSLEEIWYKMVTPHPSVFLKKEIYNKYGFFNTEYKMAADYELVLRLYCKGIKFSYINDILANFRIGGLSTKKFNLVFNETIQVIENYLELCPKKELVKNIIDDRKKNFRFNQLCEENIEIIKEVLKYKFEYLEKGVYVFGTGIWGEKINNLLNENGVPIICFIDNNRQKWNLKFKNRDVNNPNILKDIKGNVIIAIKKNTELIIEQLKNFNNDDLQWITLVELMTWVILEDENKKA